MSCVKMESNWCLRWAFVTLILLVGNEVLGQWYTDPHNPVAVYGPVSESGGLMADLNGSAYFFIYGPYESAMMSHVNVDGQWSCPLPGVVIGPHYSGWAHTEVLDPDNNLIAHGTNVNAFEPATPSLLNKWSPSGGSIWSLFSFPDTLTRPHYIVSDGAGGCIILVTIGHEQVNWYVQHFDASGYPQLGWTERPFLGTGSLGSVSLISDGVGGGFAIWPLLRDSIRIVQMQHIRPDGSFAFPDSGIAIVENGYYYYGIHGSSAGSFILEWTRPQMEYHCTRFDSIGTIIWDHLRDGWDYITTDCLGGLYFFEEDDITYGRINAIGDVVFTGHSLAPWSQFAYGKTVSLTGELSILNWNDFDEVWTLKKYDSLGIQIWADAVPILYDMPEVYCEGLIADTRGGVILFFSQQSGTYFTRVDAYGNVGSSVHVTPLEIVPTHFEISAYPNPFNSQINLTWTTNIGGVTWLNISNLLGQKVLSVELPAHATHYIWDGRDAWGTPVSSGVFYASLQTKRIKQSIKIVLIK